MNKEKLKIIFRKINIRALNIYLKLFNIIKPLANYSNFNFQTNNEQSFNTNLYHLKPKLGNQ